MCGIAGILHPFISAQEREEVLARMNRCMLHRGPDEGAFRSFGECTLGMRRLAIFDPANGHQPMRSADGRYALVFNGAIYNFRELRTELVGHGHHFTSECDTEVLLAAFAQWGSLCTSRLRGMYAFAVWDTHRHRLTLARDPLGIKPLFVSLQSGTLLFASEVSALLASGLVARTLDQDALVDYLRWFTIPAPRTLHSEIRSLLPGEILHWEDGHHDSGGGWALDRLDTLKPAKSIGECAEQLRFELAASIRAHSAADVPVGAFLSGGLDSSLITALMAREAGTRLKTFSIGLENPDFNEAAEAAESAHFLGTEHHSHTLTGSEVARDIEQIIAAMDQPTGDGINTFYVSKLAKAGGVTVALSGLGGDELFGGYPSFDDIPKLAGWLPRWRLIPRPLRSLAVSALRAGDTRQLKLADFLHYAATGTEAAALHRRVNSEPCLAGLLRPEFRNAEKLGSPLHPRHRLIERALENKHPKDIASAYELQGYMADVLLRDSDVMSMRHSLELRTPFVDLPLLTWAWSQKPEFKYAGGLPKHLLTLAFRDLLPPGLATRKKRGFSLPFDTWMRSDLRPFLDESFTTASIESCPLLDPSEVRGRWTSYLARRDPREWSRIWSLAILINLCKKGASK